MIEIPGRQFNWDPVGDCVEWNHCRITGGYGQCTYQNKRWLVHRLIWTLEVGPIPDGINVLHQCDNPPCCLIEHLFLGSQEENVRDAWLKRRMAGQDNYVSVW